MLPLVEVLSIFEISNLLAKINLIIQLKLHCKSRSNKTDLKCNVIIRLLCQIKCSTNRRITSMISTTITFAVIASIVVTLSPTFSRRSVTSSAIERLLMKSQVLHSIVDDSESRREISTNSFGSSSYLAATIRSKTSPDQRLQSQ